MHIKLKNMKSYTHKVLEENGYKMGKEIVDDNGNRIYTLISVNGNGPTKYSEPHESLKDFIGRAFSINYIEGRLNNSSI